MFAASGDTMKEKPVWLAESVFYIQESA